MNLFRRAAGLAACLVLALPAFASDSEIPSHADRFVRALQQQRFDDAAAMFKSRDKLAPAATAATLKRIGAVIGGFGGMRNVLTLPNGSTRKLEIPSSATLTPRPNRFHQVVYSTAAGDGRPVYYILALDGGAAPQAVLWFEVHLPTPDAAATERAERFLEALI